MKVFNKLTPAFAGAVLLGMMSPAYGIGTDADSDIDNTASVSFDVGAGAETAISTHVFKVDRKVILTVAEANTADTVVIEGATNQVLTFTVTNDSNDTLDVALSFFNRASASVGPRGNIDNFDPITPLIYIDGADGTGTDGDGVFVLADDTLISSLNDLPEDATATVFIVSEIPDPQANGSVAVMDLQARAADPAGGDATDLLAESGAADDPLTVENVFADLAGTAAGDVAQDGKHSDDDAYLVDDGATVSVNKSSRVISDGFSPAGEEKPIPGAVIEYCVEVTNNSGSTSDPTTLTDDLSAQIASGRVDYVVDSIVVGSTSCAVSDGTPEFDDGSGPLGATFAADVVTVPFGAVLAGQSRRVQYRITLD